MPMKAMIVKTNPLAMYKNSDPMLEWQMISAQCGISIQTLISIASKDEKTIGGVTLKTVKCIKKNLGIDLEMYYKETDDKASGNN